MAFQSNPPSHAHVHTQAIGDINIQGNSARAVYMRSWYNIAEQLISRGISRVVVGDLYNRTQKIVSDHDVYLQFPLVSANMVPANYLANLSAAVQNLEDRCWHQNWTNTPRRMRAAGWLHAANAIEALGNNVLMNWRYCRDLTARDQFDALWPDMERQLSSRGADVRTLDRFRGLKERLNHNLEEHGSFFITGPLSATMSPQAYCEQLMMEINQNRVNRVKAAWGAAIAAAPFQEKAVLGASFSTMTERVTANYPAYPPYSEAPPKRHLTTAGFDDVQQTIFSQASSERGTWTKRATPIGEGAYAAVHVWTKWGENMKILDRVAVKEMYLEPGHAWISPTHWEAPIHVRIPTEYAMARLLNDLGAENVVKHRDYGLYERIVMFRLYMEYCEHEDLRRAIERHVNAGQRIPLRAVWAVFEAMAATLVFMERGSLPGHATPNQHRSQYHRDIKPDNIFLTTAKRDKWPMIPTPKLGDFGNGIWTASPASHAPGAGTLQYMAPESNYCDRPEEEQHLDGHHVYHTVSLKSDVWSLGRTIMAMMNRELYIQEMGRFGCLDDEPTFHGTDGARYPLSLQNLVLRCLREDPVQRPTPSQLWTDIQREVINLKNVQPSDNEPQLMIPPQSVNVGLAFGAT